MKTTSLFALICVLNLLSAKEFPFYILTNSTDTSKLTAENLLLGAERVTKQKFVKCRLTDELGKPKEREITIKKSQKKEMRMCYKVMCETTEKRNWTYNSYEYDEFFGLVKEKAQLPVIVWVFIAFTLIAFTLIVWIFICKPALPESPMSDDEIPEESRKTTSFNLHIKIDEDKLSRGEFSTGEYENALLNMKGINQMQEDFDAKMQNSSTIDIIPSAVPTEQAILADGTSNEPEEQKKIEIEPAAIDRKQNEANEQNRIEPAVIDTVDSIHSTIKTIANIFEESHDQSSSIFSSGK